MVEHVVVDPIVDEIANFHHGKIGFVQAGQMLGSIDQLYHKEKWDSSAMCKTDCLMLVIDQNIIKLLQSHKEKLARDFALESLTCYIPSLLRFYTSIRICEHIMKTLEDVIMLKGEYVVKENQPFEEVPDFYLVLNGQIEITKTLKFLD